MFFFQYGIKNEIRWSKRAKGLEIGCVVTIAVKTKEEKEDLAIHFLHIRKCYKENGHLEMISGHYVPGLTFRNCPDERRTFYGF